jgi:hypothetical protein
MAAVAKAAKERSLEKFQDAVNDLSLPKFTI